MPTGIGDEVAWWCPSLDDTGNGTLTFYDQIASGIDGALDNGETGDWVADTSSGGVRAITVDGSNERGVIADDNRFTFGNASTDSAFSISIWIYMTSIAAANGIFCKASSATAGEWYLVSNATGQLIFRCVDNSTGGYIGRTTAASTVAINTWYNIVCTYSGSGLASGVKIYLNGSVVDNADSNTGSYTAMENIAVGVFIGSRGGLLYLPGRWDDARIFDVDLSGVSGAVSDLASQRGYQPATGGGPRRRRILCRSAA